MRSFAQKRDNSTVFMEFTERKTHCVASRRPDVPVSGSGPSVLQEEGLLPRSLGEREKMTCSILLLITLTSCVCGSFPPAGTFVVNVTQSSYQAEENEDITLEWTFTTKPDSSNSLYIYCELITDLKASVLYHLQEGVEVPESQDGQFAVRVQCDRDVLREGQLRLHVSRLRTEDSGLYQCEVSTTYGGSVGKSRLTVTAAADEPKPQRPTVRPQPESRGRIGLCAGLGLTAAALLAVSAGLCFAFGLCFTKSTDKRGNVSAAVYRC
ncbi:uncharacterized protein LOC122870207 isoform X3 [Siniperca chuatsi]|uniref:uncharacterized protein LOC122870207 isoform X3 n=1 Tax=Siniperca chuatsi TaxID=119488 RepID=UPI001CE11852|nr:uncharacterized protein LOC122870207 isoform X3 [Siniperca chuatsi]